ncbi:MAG: eL32 family ribosomal protein [Candidatus Micrarchaeia archaeon]
MATKRTHPKFLRPNYGRSSRSRIKLAWRRPRGIDNKKRAKIKYMGCSPSIGYGQPLVLKGKHPKGLDEIIVQTPAELKGLKDVVVRIAGGVGRVKREAIIKLCEAAKIHVVNKSKNYPVKKPKVAKTRADAKKAEEPKTRAETPKAETPKAEAPKAAEPAKKAVN